MTSTTLQKTPRRLTLLSVLAALGLGAGIWLSHVYYSVRDGSAGFQSACSVNAQFNCDAVAVSRWAEIAPGVPLSSLAAGAFLSVLIVSLIARIDSWRRESVRFLLLLSLISSLFAATYLLIMTTQLKTLCLFCLAIDAVSFGSLGVVLSLRPESPKRAPIDGGKWKSLLGTAAGAVLVAVVLLKGMDQTQITASEIHEAAQAVVGQTQLEMKGLETAPFLGSADAPVTIVKFSDYQCPACRMGAMVMHHLLARHPGKIKLVLRNFPLDSGCNPQVQKAMHPAACEAARVATCSHQQGKLAETYEVLFDQQSQLAPGRAAELAASKGVDRAKLDACVASSESSQSVSRDVEEGARLGVRSTPTFFVNGRRIEGVYPLPVWDQIIELLAQ